MKTGKPLVDMELVNWLQARYPNGYPTSPQQDLNETNFRAGQQAIISVLRHLAQSTDESNS